MQSSAETVSEYLKELPPERKKQLQKIRQSIKAALPAGYKETMQYGMISYVVPLKLYPEGYLGKPDTPVPFLSLASQKNYMAIYMMCVYGKEEELFRKKYSESGKKLDMGKCCVRFRNAEDLALDVVCDEIRRWPVDAFLERYAKARSGAQRSAKTKAPSKKRPVNAKRPAKRAVGKKTAAKNRGES